MRLELRGNTWSVSFEKTAHIPMTKRTLKTAEPTIVPKPTADCVNVPMSEVKSSGAEPPAAMKVAPATSGDTCSVSTSTSSAGTKYSSQTIASARKM